MDLSTALAGTAGDPELIVFIPEDSTSLSNCCESSAHVEVLRILNFCCSTVVNFASVTDCRNQTTFM